ncbi:MAG: hypothetical protein H0Z29_03320 [Candidatus Marinimicrobia bacterium]|nr:hypothetical protein [Candidatus Neomarinimicrobiota bacterium]
MPLDDNVSSPDLNPLESIHSIRGVDRESKREKRNNKNKKKPRDKDRVEISSLNQKMEEKKKIDEEINKGIKNKGGKIDILAR